MTMGIKMVDRAFGQLHVGDTAELEFDVTSERIAAFAELSGDRNPLHTSEDYAHSTGFGRPIAHGHLVAAPVSTLAGYLLPGKRCLILEIHFRFVRPVYAGERLVYRGVVSHVAPAVHALKVDVEATRVGGETVMRGSYQCKVLGAT